MPAAMRPSEAPLPDLGRALVGIGWRHPHYEELLRRQPALDFLEVHSENFFARGGAAFSVLEAARRDYPIKIGRAHV